jgi:y4mF family transcriptional regulator
MTKIGQYVKDERKRLKIRQEDFASQAGVSSRFVRDLEQGKESMRLDKVNQVLNVLGMEVGAVPMPRKEEHKQRRAG